MKVRSYDSIYMVGVWLGFLHLWYQDWFKTLPKSSLFPMLMNVLITVMSLCGDSCPIVFTLNKTFRIPYPVDIIKIQWNFCSTTYDISWFIIVIYFRPLRYRYTFRLHMDIVRVNFAWQSYDIHENAFCHIRPLLAESTCEFLWQQTSDTGLGAFFVVILNTLLNKQPVVLKAMSFIKPRCDEYTKSNAII